MTVVDADASANWTLNVSPLHEFWAARSHQNDWIELGGLTLPGVLDDWRAETAALAGAAGFAELTWRHAYLFSGPDLQDVLARLFDIPQIRSDGRWYDTTWQDERGFLRGAGRLGMVRPDQALLCTYARDFAWLMAAAAGYELTVSVLPLQGLRLAGPAQRSALETLTTGMSGVEMSLPGMAPVWADVREQGHTDLWCDPDQAYALAQALTRRGLRPVGVRAMEAWRVQAGLARAGADWTPVQEVLDLRDARRTGELVGPASTFYLAELPGPSPQVGFSSVTGWPPTGQVFGIGWSLLGHYQESKDGNGARFLKAAATD